MTDYASVVNRILLEKMMPRTPEEERERQRIKAAKYRAAHPEKARASSAASYEKRAAGYADAGLTANGTAFKPVRVKQTEEERRAKYVARLEAEKAERHARAITEGKEPGRRGYAAYLTDEERRDHKRKWSAQWRAANRRRAREITRDAEKRAAAQKAMEEGREPGKIGRPAFTTEEERRHLKRLRYQRYYAVNGDKVREISRNREQAKRDGTFVSRARPRLTAEERRLVNVMWAAARRARVRNNGGTFTRADIALLMIEQDGLCGLCFEPMGTDIHIDHWLPISLGGKNDATNIQLTHPRCNMIKGAQHPLSLVLPLTG